MFRKKLLAKIAQSIVSPEFKIIQDIKGNEYVLFRDSKLENLDALFVDDKTLFEAMDNHIHFLDKVRKSEMPYLKRIAECVCELTLGKLEATFPTKKFVVSVAIQIGESVIFRFHQLWTDELPYYQDEGNGGNLIIVSKSSKKTFDEQSGDGKK